MSGLDFHECNTKKEIYKFTPWKPEYGTGYMISYTWTEVRCSICDNYRYIKNEKTERMGQKDM